MDTTLALLLSSAVIAAIVSGIIAPFINRSQERRKIRAAVLEALLGVERSRWASDEFGYDRYIQDVHKLRAQALIARTHRSLVEFYVQASALARSGSDDDFETNKGSEFSGSIDTDIADFVSETAEALINYLWHPYLGHISMKQNLEQLKARRAQLKRKYNSKRPASERIYDWDRRI